MRHFPRPATGGHLLIFSCESEAKAFTEEEQARGARFAKEHAQNSASDEVDLLLSDDTAPCREQSEEIESSVNPAKVSALGTSRKTMLTFLYFNPLGADNGKVLSSKCQFFNDLWLSIHSSHAKQLARGVFSTPI